MEAKSVKVEIDAEGKHTVVPVAESQVEETQDESQEDINQEEQEDETQEHEGGDSQGGGDSSDEQRETEDDDEQLSHDEEQDSRGDDQEQVLDDSSILDYLKEKHGKEFSTVEDLFVVKEPEVLPDNIQKLLDFQKETNGTIEDFVKINKDWSSVSDSDLMREYLREQKPHLSSSDIDFELENMFSIDEDLDSDKEIRAKQIAQKDFIYQAKNHFSGLGDKFKASLESGISNEVSEETQQIIDWKKGYDKQVQSSQELAQKQRDSFLEKTNELFVDSFEGFEFKIADDKVQVFKPTEVKKVKENNLDVGNLLSKFVDENGFISDAKGYHRAMAIASNPDEFAKFFYEQGKSDAIEGVESTSKNDGVRQVHTPEEGGDKPKFRAMNSETTQHGKMRLKHY